nr:hypothetical protein [Tanacetum cinerariifolium]
RGVCPSCQAAAYVKGAFVLKLPSSRGVWVKLPTAAFKKRGVYLKLSTAAYVKGVFVEAATAAGVLVWLSCRSSNTYRGVCLKLPGSSPLGVFVLAAKQQLRDVWQLTRGCLFIAAEAAAFKEVFVSSLQRIRTCLFGCCQVLPVEYVWFMYTPTRVRLVDRFAPRDTLQLLGRAVSVFVLPCT